MSNRPRTLYLLTIITFTLLVFSCHRGKENKEGVAAADSVSAGIASLTQQITDDPGNADLYLSRAKLYMSNNQAELALSDASKAISINGKNPKYFVTLSDIQLLMGKTGESEASLRKAMTLDPKNKDILLKMAKLYLILRNYPGTYEYVKKSLEVDKLNPGAWFISAQALLEQGDTNQAIANLMKATDADQQYFDAYMLLGDLYSIKNDPLTAGYYTNAVRIKPSNRAALYSLAMFYQENGQFDKAIKTYEQLQKADSLFRNAPYNIGYIYLVYLNDYKTSIDYFTRAIKIDPRYFEAYFNRGYANELLGNLDMAEQDYREALKIEVNYPKAVDGLNRIDAAKRRKQ